MTRVAAIDIGTNSVLLLVAERRGPTASTEAVLERATITRLGEGVDRTRALAPAAMERTLACLRDYAAAAQAEGVTAIDAVGTSAMRDAQGGGEFRAAAARILGVEPRIISGEQEAALTFAGGLSGIELGPGSHEVGVFDIGGGSTEIIAGSITDGVATIERSTSLDVGSVRLTERHLHSDPPSAAELAACSADIERLLRDAPSIQGRKLVGVAGTVTTLAAISARIAPYDGARVHGAGLSLDDLTALAERLAALPVVKRRELPGLSPGRADVIVAGAMLCRLILKKAGATELTVSDRGVRWGVAERLLQSPSLA